MIAVPKGVGSDPVAPAPPEDLAGPTAAIPWSLKVKGWGSSL